MWMSLKCILQPTRGTPSLCREAGLRPPVYQLGLHVIANALLTGYSRTGKIQTFRRRNPHFIPEREEKRLTFAECMVYYSRTVTIWRFHYAAKRNQIMRGHGQKNSRPTAFAGGNPSAAGRTVEYRCPLHQRSGERQGNVSARKDPASSGHARCRYLHSKSL